MGNIELKADEKYVPFFSIGYTNSAPLVEYYQENGENIIFVCCEKNKDKNIKNYLYIDPKKNLYELSIDEWGEIIANSKEVNQLLDRLKKHQDEIYIRQWVTPFSFSPLFDKYNLKTYGFSPKESQILNDKIYQYKLLKDVVPTPEFIITNKEEAICEFDNIKSNIGAYTVLPIGDSGEGTFLHKNKQELEKHLLKITNDRFMLTKAIDKKSSPTIDVLIANENEILPFGLSDQMLKNGTDFYGSTFPSKLNEDVQEKCCKLTRKVGKKLGKEGYRGLVNIDIIIDKNDKPYFCEINARYAGASSNRIMAFDVTKTKTMPCFYELEKLAIKNKSFNNIIPSSFENKKNIFYAKFAPLAEKKSGIIKKIDIKDKTFPLFYKKHGLALVGRLAPDSIINKNKRLPLGKFFAVAETQKKLNNLIEKSEKLIDEYIADEKI